MKLSRPLSGDFKCIAAELEKERSSPLPWTTPSELLRYGFTHPPQLYNSQLGVPLLDYGYMMSHDWMRQFAVEKGLWDDIDPDDMASFSFVGLVAREIKDRLQLVVPPRLFYLPGGNERMVVVGMASNVSPRGIKHADNLKKKQALMEFFGMTEEPKWFITAYA
ncbi:hypothetical protein EIP91_008702 [Steccherinum ochraceum]|uniref:Uncharacterized protein n=1 Tax=Steccherinum ochraceum TaxID=92696 RepID=A0A4R0R561_9APHY|nr:hypothetical protein EIP91_008702 [Steccherinum ochraceum]